MQGLSINSVEEFFDQYTISPHVLRVEAVLDASKSSYEFDLNKGTDTLLPMENKLNTNDTFAITDLAVLIHKYNTNVNPSNDGNFMPFAFPDPKYFNGVAVNGVTEQASLMSIFNGDIYIEVEGKKILPAYPISHMMTNPMATYTAVAPIDFQQWGPSDPERGIRRFDDPNWILNGKMRNLMAIKLPSFAKRDNIAGANNTHVPTSANKVCILLKGYLITTGGTEKMCM
jgi:hypothetical protein